MPGQRLNKIIVKRPSKKRGAPNPADPVRPFFEPRGVAVVGASSNPRKGGHIVVANLQRIRYRGPIYPVNPSGEPILGLRTFASLAEVPEPCELAVLVVPQPAVIEVVEQAGRRGIRNLVIATGGFSDMGEKGRREERRVADRARALGIRLMGPNSIGTISPAAGMVTSITTLKPLRPGGVSFCGQTGVFGSGFAAMIESSERFGIARIACLGNKADLADVEFLEFFARDQATRVLGIYVEGVRDGRSWARALERVSRAKPVIVMKSGRTEEGARAVSSHTGTMAGADRVYDAVFRRAGAFRVDSFEEMFDLAKAFEFCPLPARNRIGVVSITGVGCVLASDQAGRYGLRLPDFSAPALEKMRAVVPPWAPLRNPADIWSAIEKVGGENAYSAVSLTAARDKNIDILGLIFVLIPESDFDIARLAGELKKTKKPALATILGGAPEVVRKFTETLEANQVPVYTSVNRMLAAAGALAARAGFLRERKRNPAR